MGCRSRFYLTLYAFQESYDQLDLDNDYPIDLYLMNFSFSGCTIKTLIAMLYIQRDEYIKSMGVSNFGIEYL